MNASFERSSSTPINSAVLATCANYAQQFRAAEPFRHVLIPNFLNESLCRRLLLDFPRFEDRYALNEMGHVGGKAVRMDVSGLSQAYQEIDRYLQTDEFLNFVSSVTGIPNLLYDPDYVGGGTHENRHGQGLDQHVDFNYHPGTRWHRRLNLIVYLNPEWDEAWGGNLELHSDPWSGTNDRIKRIVPLFNHAVIFETTETSWHGFSTIQLPQDRQGLSRKSFAIYLYTKERPQQETAPTHATVYVPEAMPAHLSSGSVLSAADIQALQQRFERMLTQLKFLYEREKEFGTQITRLEQALQEARDAQKLELQGYVIQPQPLRGRWPDGWFSRNFSTVFVPTRRAHGLLLDVWVPLDLPEDQVLSIALAGKRYEHRIKRGNHAVVRLPLTAEKDELIELTIQATQEWTPSHSGTASDDRALAYRLISAVLEHSP